MSTKEMQETENLAGNHVGHFFTVDGLTIAIPMKIETRGTEAVEEFVAAACEKAGIRVVRVEGDTDIYVPRAISANGDEEVEKYVTEVREKRSGKVPAAPEPPAPATTRKRRGE